MVTDFNVAKGIQNSQQLTLPAQNNFNNPISNSASFSPFKSSTLPSQDVFIKKEEAEQSNETEKPKGKKLLKGLLSALGVAIAVSGGLVLANKQGWIKKVDNPTNLWDKAQDKLSKTGSGIESKAVNYYNRFKNTVSKTKENRKISENLDKLPKK